MCNYTYRTQNINIFYLHLYQIGVYIWHTSIPQVRVRMCHIYTRLIPYTYRIMCGIYTCKMYKLTVSTVYLYHTFYHVSLCVKRILLHFSILLFLTIILHFPSTFVTSHVLHFVIFYTIYYEIRHDILTDSYLHIHVLMCIPPQTHSRFPFIFIREITPAKSKQKKKKKRTRKKENRRDAGGFSWNTVAYTHNTQLSIFTWECM